MRVQISEFKGDLPSFGETQAGPEHAKRSAFCRFVNGRIEAWQESEILVRDLDYKTRRAHPLGNGAFILSNNENAKFVEWHTGCPRVYTTGLERYPAVAAIKVEEDGNVTLDGGFTRIGLPRPKFALEALYNGTINEGRVDEGDTGAGGSGSNISRTYVYTFINRFGEEGAPSLPSNRIITPALGQPGRSTVTLTGFEVNPNDDYPWGITAIRLYREGPGFNPDGGESPEKGKSDYFLVGEFKWDQKITEQRKFVFTDELDTNIGPAISSETWAPPPEDLEGITDVPGTLFFCGWKENELWFSDHGRPWSWPIKHRLVLDDRIVCATGAYGGVIQVGTDSGPYTIQAEPEQDGSRKVVKHPQIMPMVGNQTCVTEAGVFWVTHTGLVLSDGFSSPFIVSSPWYSPGKWAESVSSRVSIGYYQGHLFLATGLVKMILKPATPTGWRNLADIQMTGLPIRRLMNIFNDRGGGLLYIVGKDNKAIKKWNASGKKLRWRWCSSAIWGIGAWQAGAVTAELDGQCSFKLLGEDSQVLGAKRGIKSGYVYLLPQAGRHKKYYIYVCGTANIWNIRVATSRAELVQ